jgi:hypothetical protein
MLNSRRLIALVFIAGIGVGAAPPGTLPPEPIRPLTPAEHDATLDVAGK